MRGVLSFPVPWGLAAWAEWPERAAGGDPEGAPRFVWLTSRTTSTVHLVERPDDWQPGDLVRSLCGRRLEGVGDEGGHRCLHCRRSRTAPAPV